MDGGLTWIGHGTFSGAAGREVNARLLGFSTRAQIARWVAEHGLQN
jgi:hypothetical protein